MFSSKSLLDDDDVVLIDAPTLPLSALEAASDAVVTVGVDKSVVETVDAVSQPSMTHIDGGSLQKTVNTTATKSIQQQQQQRVEEDEDAHIEQELLQINQAQVIAAEGDNNNTRVPQLYKGIQTPLRGKSLSLLPSHTSYYVLIDIHTPYHYTRHNSDL